MEVKPREERSVRRVEIDCVEPGRADVLGEERTVGFGSRRGWGSYGLAARGVLLYV